MLNRKSFDEKSPFVLYFAFFYNNNYLAFCVLRNLNGQINITQCYWSKLRSDHQQIDTISKDKVTPIDLIVTLRSFYIHGMPQFENRDFNTWVSSSFIPCKILTLWWHISVTTCQIIICGYNLLVRFLVLTCQFFISLDWLVGKKSSQLIA